MATYVIGDIHGRFETLEALFAQIPFQAGKDHLWLTGDLVNRGPRSLHVLRWAHAWSERLGERMVAVLGNHDIHLLRLHLGLRQNKLKDSDLRPILESKDRHLLIDWLRHRPLLHRRDDVLLVHAGLLPSWTPRKAEVWARRVEQQLLQDATVKTLLDSRPQTKDDAPSVRSALDALTRLRTLDSKGEPCSFSGPPNNAPKGCVPWFAHPHRQNKGVEILFGHWAALGLHREADTTCLDSGCAWGGQLTALRLDDRTLFQQEVIEPAPRPG